MYANCLWSYENNLHVYSTGLAEILKGIVVKYDNLFECNFPYMFGWHGKLKDFNASVAEMSNGL